MAFHLCRIVFCFNVAPSGQPSEDFFFFLLENCICEETNPVLYLRRPVEQKNEIKINCVLT